MFIKDFFPKNAVFFGESVFTDGMHVGQFDQ